MLIRRVRLLILLKMFVLCLINPMYVAADENSAERKSPARYLDEVVVTATRGEKPLEEVPADVEVLDKQSIETAPSTNVDDMLKRFGGVDVNKPSDMAVTNHMGFTIRGVYGANRVLYMVDGVPLNSALTGFVIPGVVQPSSVERIEVVKGAFSSLYGSNAMGGVINIITSKPDTDGFKAKPFISAGDFGFRESGITLQGKKDRISGSLDASYRKIDNHYRNKDRVKYAYNLFSGTFNRKEIDTTNANYHEARVRFRLNLDASEKSGITLSGNYSQSYTGMGETNYLPLPMDRDMDRILYFLNLDGYTRLFDSVAVEGRLYTNYDETKFDDENIVEDNRFLLPFYRYEYGDRYYWGRDNGMQLKSSLPIGAYNFLTFGTDINYKQGYWRNRGSKKQVIDRVMKKSLMMYSFYAQNETELFNRLSITIGGRVDVNSRSDNAFSPKFGFLYRATDRISVRGSVGRAFRAPNLAELYQPAWQMIPGIPFMGNTELDPEKIWSYDLGVTVRVMDNTTLKFTGFYSQAKDLIDGVISRGIMRYENLSRVNTDGFEAGLETFPLDWLSFYMNYTYTHSVDKDMGRLGNIPLHRINSGVSTVFEITPHAVLTSSLDLRFSDSLFYMDRMTKNSTKLSSFTVIDMAHQLKIFDRLSIKGVITNLVNQKYEQHSASVGPARSFWLKVEYDF